MLQLNLESTPLRNPGEHRQGLNATKTSLMRPLVSCKICAKINEKETRSPKLLGRRTG